MSDIHPALRESRRVSFVNHQSSIVNCIRVFNRQSSIYNRHFMRRLLLLLTVLCAPLSAQLQPADLYHLRSVSDVALSPDGDHVAYVVENNDGPGRPYEQIWLMDLRSGKNLQLSAGADTSGNPVWSPSGEWLAYGSDSGDKSGLFIVHANGAGARFLAPVESTNSPEPHV